MYPQVAIRELVVNAIIHQDSSLRARLGVETSNTDSTFELDLLPAQTVLAAHRNSRSANLVQTWNRYQTEHQIKGLLF